MAAELRTFFGVAKKLNLPTVLLGYHQSGMAQPLNKLEFVAVKRRAPTSSSLEAPTSPPSPAFSEFAAMGGWQKSYNHIDNSRVAGKNLTRIPQYVPLGRVVVGMVRPVLEDFSKVALKQYLRCFPTVLLGDY